MNADYRKNFAAIDWKPLPAPERKASPSRRADFPTPRVMRDTMDPLQSMTDGNFYTSKSELRKEYRRAGVIEVGNETQTTGRAQPIGRDDGSIDAALSAVGL